MLACMNIRSDSLERAPARTAYQLGQAIVDRRCALGLSQQELADELGVYRTNLSKLERGEATIQLELLFAILHELGLELTVKVRASS
jgi:HTH-type transcriptional regulator / antitoxin HipB